PCRSILNSICRIFLILHFAAGKRYAHGVFYHTFQKKDRGFRQKKGGTALFLLIFYSSESATLSLMIHVRKKERIRPPRDRILSSYINIKRISF
ncbi:MAG: hypothetical protein WAS03_08650, partial [Fusicatenibacter saccharivorans]